MRLFSRKPKSKTGHPGDDQLLGIIATLAGGTAAPREWIHYLYCETDDGAGLLEAAASRAGWDVHRTAAGAGIVASRADLAVNAETVRVQREYFEALASQVPGGEYDGWEAAA
ncbi:ribonuclease E inhibitor RraB [Leifsonia sp. A12D58]|uniref:ribonuclease E inhibitor RraB n=1 Tax=Leifsonia sp. A12D58 TaxID=3397674 RepID=UPI0039E0883A